MGEGETEEREREAWLSEYSDPDSVSEDSESAESSLSMDWLRWKWWWKKKTSLERGKPDSTLNFPTAVVA